MSPIKIAWRNQMKRKTQLFITLFIISIGVAMTISVISLSNGVKKGIIEASEPYGMIVGSKGSATQLVFNTIFLTDTPLGNIDYEHYEDFKQDERVQSAVPFALGDNYKGYRIVGTSEEFFHLKGNSSDAYFQIQDGEYFRDAFQAVIGAKAARETNLKIGDTFASSHGVMESIEGGNAHGENPYTVVGILKEKNIPADQGIYVRLDSYWISHKPEHSPGVGQVGNQEEQEHSDEEGHGEEHHSEENLSEDHQDNSAVNGVTAVLVKPDTYSNLMKIYQEVNNGEEAQAVFPGKVLAKVFDMMGSGETFLKIISYIVLGIGGLTIILSLFGSMLERRRTVAILRAIGASRPTIFNIVVLESVIVIVIGSVIGCCLGFLLTNWLAVYITSQSAIPVIPQYSFELLYLLLGVCIVGVIAGLLPAYSACRTEAVKYLSPL
jgi:putative ABC transport system permease protein